MSWVTAVTAAMTLAAPLVVAYVVLIEIPSVQHSRFRHQLWALRDDLVDDAIAGRVRQDAAFGMLMALLTSGIADASRHTMMAAALNVKHTRHLVPKRLVDDIVLGGEGGPERALMAGYLDRYRRISKHHLLTGAPSGWLYWVAKQAQRQRQDLPGAAVDMEIVEAPAKRPDLVLHRPAPC